MDESWTKQLRSRASCRVACKGRVYPSNCCEGDCAAQPTGPPDRDAMQGTTGQDGTGLEIRRCGK